MCQYCKFIDKKQQTFEDQKQRSIGQEIIKATNEALEYMQNRKEVLNFPNELLDHLEVLKHSAKIGKYRPNDWLNKDGKGCDHKSQYASIFRHVAEAYNGIKKDKDSGLDPRLHAAIRLMMDYTRDQKGLVHPLVEGK